MKQKGEISAVVWIKGVMRFSVTPSGWFIALVYPLYPKDRVNSELYAIDPETGESRHIQVPKPPKPPPPDLQPDTPAIWDVITSPNNSPLSETDLPFELVIASWDGVRRFALPQLLCTPPLGMLSG